MGLLEVWGERGELPGRWVTTYDGFFLLARVLIVVAAAKKAAASSGCVSACFSCLPLEQQRVKLVSGGLP